MREHEIHSYVWVLIQIANLIHLRQGSFALIKSGSDWCSINGREKNGRVIHS